MGAMVAAKDDACLTNAAAEEGDGALILVTCAEGIGACRRGSGGAEIGVEGSSGTYVNVGTLVTRVLRRCSATSSRPLVCCVAFSVSSGGRGPRTPVASVEALALATPLPSPPVRKSMQVEEGERCTVGMILFEAVATIQ